MNNVERGKKIAAAKRNAKDRYQGGHVPFGYRKKSDGTLEEDPKTYPVLKGIKEHAGKGLRPREIEKSLSGRGIKVSHMTIYRIIKRTLANQ
jgi:hypothetical protein